MPYEPQLVTYMTEQFLQGDLFTLNLLKDYCEEYPKEAEEQHRESSPTEPAEDSLVEFALMSVRREIPWDLKKTPALAASFLMRWGYMRLQPVHEYFTYDVYFTAGDDCYYIVDVFSVHFQDLDRVQVFDVGEVFENHISTVMYTDQIYPSLFRYTGSEWHVSSYYQGS